MNSALFTDFYELTMAQGFWRQGMNFPAVFDMFFRRQPFGSGFSVFAGLETLLDDLQELHFSAEDLDYLKEQNLFDADFLEYLSNFSFKGDLYAMDEGSVIFPNEPILRIHGGLIEAQIIEGLVLNKLNFQSLIATKTARIYLASRESHLMEFGLRRAQGFDGAMSASRAAFIGGAKSTSNTLAGRMYGIPVQGTMAHSWIMSFKSELEAFETYAKMYPDNSVFLIDTYDTLNSGIKNAIIVGKKLIEQGKRFGVRLDSGDIQYLSQKVRKCLDDAGCHDAFIAVSNELNEEIIETLVQQNAPIDSWGVGTHMVTGGSESSFTGVYKLAARSEQLHQTELIPTMKFSDNPEKTTNPGIKNVWRIFDETGMAVGDVLTLEGEEIIAGKEHIFHHPSTDYRYFTFTPSKVEPLLKLRLKEGKLVEKQLPEKERLLNSKKRLQEQLAYFDSTFKRQLNPHIYKVSISEKLRDLKLSFIESHKPETKT